MSTFRWQQLPFLTLFAGTIFTDAYLKILRSLCGREIMDRYCEIDKCYSIQNKIAKHPIHTRSTKLEKEIMFRKGRYHKFHLR